MTTATMKREATRLLGRLGQPGCGADCPPVRLLFRGGPWHSDERPMPCPRCGAPARVFTVSYDVNFYPAPGGVT
jgi:hypothetical protein